MTRMGEGQWSQAAVLLEELLAHSPDDPRVSSYLSECYLNLGDRERAQAVLDPKGDTTPYTPMNEGGFENPEVRSEEPQTASPSMMSAEEIAAQRKAYWDGRHREDGRLRRYGVAIAIGGNSFGWGLMDRRGYWPVLAPGIQAMIKPHHHLSIQVGWGLSRTYVQSYWLGLRGLLYRRALTPMGGIGLVGEFGNYYHRVLWGTVRQVIYPYVEGGVIWTGPKGVHVEAGFDVVVNPQQPWRSMLWPFLRFGIML